MTHDERHDAVLDAALTRFGAELRAAAPGVSEGLTRRVLADAADVSAGWHERQAAPGHPAARPAAVTGSLWSRLAAGFTTPRGAVAALAAAVLVAVGLGLGGTDRDPEPMAGAGYDDVTLAEAGGVGDVLSATGGPDPEIARAIEDGLEIVQASVTSTGGPVTKAAPRPEAPLDQVEILALAEIEAVFEDIDPLF